MKVSFTWSTRRQGNEGFVLEQSSMGHAREFGPMPSHVVPAFVQARRRFINMMTAVANQVEDRDYSYLHVPNQQHQRGSNGSDPT